MPCYIIVSQSSSYIVTSLSANLPVTLLHHCQPTFQFRCNIIVSQPSSFIVTSLSANLPGTLLLSANLPVTLLLSASLVTLLAITVSHCSIIVGPFFQLHCQPFFPLIPVRAASLRCVHTSRTTPTPKLHSSLSLMSSQALAERISTGRFCSLLIQLLCRLFGCIP